jgi:hypothetical protein
MRKPLTLWIIGILLFTAAASYAQKPAPALKRIQLNDVQVKMLVGIEQEIEALPEVKTLRSREQGIIAGIATSNNMTRWTWKADGKGGAYVEEVAEPEKTQGGNP